MAVDIRIPPLDVILTYHIQDQEAICTLKFYTLYKIRCYGTRNMKERARLTRYEDDCTYHFALGPSEMFTLCVDATTRLVVDTGSPVLHGGTVYFVDGEVKILSSHNWNIDIRKDDKKCRKANYHE
jgi:hypothetical protein